MKWLVPKMWQGRTVYIVGGGSSIKNLDLSLIHNERCIGVNNSYMFGNWIDICWFGDSRWFEWHSTHKQFREGWRDFQGIQACCVDRCCDHKRVKYLERSIKADGIDVNPSKVCWNKTSGASAINLAYHLGAKLIVLIGFDMQIVNGEENWHNDHVKHGDNLNPYPKYLDVFPAISRDLKSLKVDIVNTSLDSTIPEEIITKKPLEDVVKGGL